MGIAQAILELRVKYAVENKVSPADINSGMCMDFAADIMNQGFGDDKWGYTLDIGYWSELVQAAGEFDAYEFMSLHCFIIYEGKYYDSECPQGCNYPDQLPCYQRLLYLLDP